MVPTVDVLRKRGAGHSFNTVGVPVSHDTVSHTSSEKGLKYPRAVGLAVISITLVACQATALATGTPTPETTPSGDPTIIAPTPAVTIENPAQIEATATPKIEVSMPSPVEGLYYGSYGVDAGNQQVITGAISPADFESSNPDSVYSVPAYGNGEVQVNTLYSEANSETPAATMLDQKWLDGFFNAQTDKTGTTTGTLPDGSTVTKQGLFWIDGQGNVLNPIVRNIAGENFGWPMLVVKDNQLFSAVVDGDGQLVGDEEFLPAFQSPQEMAASVGFDGAQNVARVALSQTGILQMFDTQGTMIGEVSYLGTAKTFEDQVATAEYATPTIYTDIVTEYSHAYGIPTADVKLHSEIQTIDGKRYAFQLTEQGIPVAILDTDGTWQKIKGKDLSRILNMDFVMPILYSDISDPKNVEILENVTKVTMTNELAMNVAYGSLTTEDWKNIIANWDTIKQTLDEGKIPEGIPYNFRQADVVFQFAAEHDLKMRVQHLLDGGDALPDSIYNGGFTRDELLKIIEFTTNVTVLKYRGQVDEWDVEDELIAGGDGKYGFWGREIGLADAVETVARIVRKLDPGASIIITENHMLDKQFAREQPYLRDKFFAFIDELQSRNVPIDGVDIENNQWVHNPPDVEFMVQILEKIKSEGLYISAGETTVLMGDTYPWYEPVANIGTATPEQIHADVVEAYIRVGARGVGFGDVADKWAFLNYSGLYDANPSLFDDNGEPKPAYYEVLKVLYEYATAQNR